jgi:heme-degrading monooxygenase HmoA
MLLAETPEPPYYAVIFTSVRTKLTTDYAETSEKMMQLAQTMQGFLGAESARSEIGITVSYWESLAAIKHWKMNTDHLMAQQLGRDNWYENYKTRIALVERDYEFHF